MIIYNLNDVESLQKLSAILHWSGIGLILLGAILSGGRYVVDKRKDALKEIMQKEKEAKRLMAESQLKEKVGNLEVELQDKDIEIEELKKNTGHLSPYLMPIRSGAVKVFITIEADEVPMGKFMGMDNMVYFAFVKDDKALMVLTTKNFNSYKSGDKTITYEASLSLDLADESIGKPLTFLTNSEYIQIHFSIIPDNSFVLDGKAILIINNNVQLDILVPHQKMDKKDVFIRNIKNIFSDFPNNK
jgi:hypothetical protein